MVQRICSSSSAGNTMSTLGKSDAKSSLLRNCSKCESLRRAEEKWHYNPTSCYVSCLMYGIRALVRHKLGRLMVLYCCKESQSITNTSPSVCCVIEGHCRLKRLRKLQFRLLFSLKLALCCRNISIAGKERLRLAWSLLPLAFENDRG
jgi:hypothetical protein